MTQRPTLVSLYLRGLYVAVERRLDPALVGRPVLVCGPKSVLAVSAEARALGARPGQPLPHARRICPKAAAIDYAAERYEPTAREALDIAARHTLRIEPIYPHEAFLDLSGCPNPPKAWKAIADDLEEPGFVPLLGIASTRFTARAAALALNILHPVDRPDVLHPTDEPGFLATLPVAALWPVDPAIRERLVHLGLRKIGDVAAVPPGDLVGQLGPAGEQVARLARGIDPTRVAALYPPLAFEEERAFDDGIADRDALDAALRDLAGRVAAEFRSRGDACYRVRLSVEVGGDPPHPGLKPTPLPRGGEGNRLTIMFGDPLCSGLKPPLLSSRGEGDPVSRGIADNANAPRRHEIRPDRTVPADRFPSPPRGRGVAEGRGEGDLHAELTLKSGIRSEDDLFRAARRAFERMRIDGPVTALRLRAEDLRLPTAVQPDLFGLHERKRRLSGLWETVRRRFGENGLKAGESLTSPRRSRVIDAFFAAFGAD